MKLIDITGKAISGEWGNDCEDGNGIPVLRTTNFTDTGVINFANVVLRDIPTKDLSKKFLRPGDIIIEKSGGSDTKPVGRVVYFDSEENKYLINNFTGLLRVVDQTKWYPRYVFYALFANYSFGGTRQYENKTTGLHNLKLDQYLNSFDIPDVDFQLQHHIADTLDKVSEGIEVCRKMLGKLDLMVKAKFVEMFGTLPANELGWSTGTIRDCITEVRYGSSRKAAEGDKGQYPYLRMNNITYDGELDLTDIKSIDIPDDELDKCSVRRGDVLFNRTNSRELVGKTCVYNRDELMVLAGFVVRVRVNERMLPEFLSAFMNSTLTKRLLLSMCKTAIGQANINAQEFQNIEIYIPPITLQREFVDLKEQIDKSKLTVQRIRDKMEMEKLALMQEYFK